MSLKHLARQALSLPLYIALVKTLRYGERIVKANIHQIIDRMRLSYQERVRVPFQPGEGSIQSFLCEGNSHLFDISFHNLPDLTSMVTEHRFDLLGSGWVKVHGKTKAWRRVSPGNRKRSSTICDQIDAKYKQIDWQLDFKSGFRWREDRLSGTLRYGHEPGVDVKVPWELARFQHLSWLAMSGDEKSMWEFRNQVLDFAATNPPGYGVNWLCTMDVAIRAANLLVAYDLFVSRGQKFDPVFISEFYALILAHGKHIAGHLEWHDLHRANHYLADIAGLLFVAAYLPRSGETDVWLAFSVQQLIQEVGLQFTSDGANFEASTSYHRLSSEMAIYATALVLGLPEDKKAALAEYDHRQWRNHPPLTPAPVSGHSIPGSEQQSPFPRWYFERLERMAEFTIHVTKPNRRIAQIGDNDNGRFFKMCPSFVEVDGNLREQHLDHRSTIAAINGLFNRSDFAEFAGADFALETSVISALAGDKTIASYLKQSDKPKAVGRIVENSGTDSNPLSVIAETIIELPDGSVLDNLTTVAYPDFGLYIWRSPRFFLSIRCGPVGQNGNGGHAHNDQLAIELNVDGEDWVADPGTYLYTPSPENRNAYRSVHAHAAPKMGDKEPSRLDFGMFCLENNVNARCLSFGPKGFEGVHGGYGVALHRFVEIGDGQIRIRDMASGSTQPEAIPKMVKESESLRKHWSLTLPFSPGYGLREGR